MIAERPEAPKNRQSRCIAVAEKANEIPVAQALITRTVIVR
jgi:hypothetical protein